MRRNKFLKGSAVVVAVALAITTMPIMAEEYIDTDPEGEMTVIEEENDDASEYLDTEEILEEKEYDDQGMDNVQEIDDEVEGDEALETDLMLFDLGDDSNPDEDPGPVIEGVVLSKEEVTLMVGQTVQLTVETTPDKDTIEQESWNSSDESIATVNNNGLVTALAAGTAYIEVSATYGGESYTDTCKVTVSSYSDGFHMDPDSGDWYYYSNGKVSDITDVIQGTVDGKNGWWNVVKGKVTRSETVAYNSNGWWYINSNGMVDFNYNGFAHNSNGWWYCENGKVEFDENSVIQDTNKKIDGTSSWWYVLGSQVQTSFTGLADYSNSNGWWYIENGKVTFNANTVATNKNGTYYVEDSKVNFNYTGFGQNDDGWWYCENGKVNFDKNSVIQDTNKKIDGASSWWYVLGSQVQTSFTGLADYSNSNGWWYIENGKVTFTKNTVAQNKNGWYYVEDSKVNFNYNGFAHNSNGWWYCENGKVNFDKNSVIQDTNKKIDGTSSWWYVVGGQVQTSFTGLADYSNENGWWYIKGGKVDFTANTVAENKNGWYYVLDGKVQFGFTGLADYSNEDGWWYIKDGKVDFTANTVAQNKNGWYYVLDGKVQFGFTGLADYSNSNGWWYIKNGKVTFDYTGFAQNKNGWYYIKDSKVDFSKNTVMQGTVNGTYDWWYVVGGKVQTGFTGLANYSNENGWWYIKNGQVDFTFNGIGTNNNGSYVVENGKVNFNYNGTYTYGGITYNVTNGKASHPATDLGMDMNMYNKAQSQSSSTKWLIMVDVTNCKLGIFQGSNGNWTPYKYWDCTTGAPGSPTCIGSYTIYGKGKSFGDSDHTCYWYSQFNGNYLIHSILYYPGTMTVKSGTLGAHLSNGCVRLSYDNAKWVYDNVPYSTRVVTYK